MCGVLQSETTPHWLDKPQNHWHWFTLDLATTKHSFTGPSPGGLERVLQLFGLFLLPCQGLGKNPYEGSSGIAGKLQVVWTRSCVLFALMVS